MEVVQLESALALVAADKAVVAGGQCDSAQGPMVLIGKVVEEVGAMYTGEIDLMVPLVGLHSVEEMIGRKLLAGDLVVGVLAGRSKNLVEEEGRHLGDPLRVVSLDLGVVLPVGSDCAYHDHHPVSSENNLHLTSCDPWVTARGETRQQQMSQCGKSPPHQPLAEMVLHGYR